MAMERVDKRVLGAKPLIKKCISPHEMNMLVLGSADRTSGDHNYGRGGQYPMKTHNETVWQKMLGEPRIMMRMHIEQTADFSLI